MNIGLVLHKSPAYSETFFQNKIIGLEASGFKVTLFAAKGEKAFELCLFRAHPSVVKNIFLQATLYFVKVGGLLVKKPVVAYRFYCLERAIGRSRTQVFENLYLNSHILLSKLDWLHFGFVNAALRRENVAKAMNAKMAVSLRGYDIAIFPLKNPGCYKMIWERLDKLHFISNDLLKLAYKHGLRIDTPYQKITPAIDPLKFKRSFSTCCSFNKPLQFLTVARLHWKKGLTHTLEALALLHKSGIDYVFTIIGSGDELESLVFTADQLGIKEKVVFAGKLSHSDVKDALTRCDIYIQYSLSEGFCNAVLEAQAMGCLCVVSDAEGLSENVLHGKTGWVVPRRSPNLLAVQILNVLKTDSKRLSEIREEAIQRVASSFNLEKQRQEFVSFYAN